VSEQVLNLTNKALSITFYS